MSTLPRPFLGTVQFAYTTDDIHRDMPRFTQRLGVGPWFITGPFVPALARFRGEPTAMELTLAVGFCGAVTVELIQQHNDAPSVYRETISRQGHGFHHWGRCTETFDADLARMEAEGYAVAFTDISPRGMRIAYLDTTASMPGMVELMESTDGLQDAYAAYHAAAQGWDGSDPVRVWRSVAPGA